MSENKTTDAQADSSDVEEAGTPEASAGPGAEAAKPGQAAGEQRDDATFRSPASPPDAAPEPDAAPREPADGDSAASVAPVVRKRGGGFVAWLALLLAILAVAAAGYGLYVDARARAAADPAERAAELDSLRTSVATTQEALVSLEQEIAASTRLAAGRDDDIARLSNELDERNRLLESLRGRLAGVEASLASLQGVSADARESWLLAEAEHYMQIANAQLQLANNPELAKLALNFADERVAELADPRLTLVRRALADELRALEVMQITDVAGVTLTLASVANSVDTLPLRQQEMTRERATPELDPELTGVERAIASVKRALGGIVSVRRTDQDLEPLIAPQASYFLRANLKLQLHAARLALLRGEKSVFRQSLDIADEWLAEYYDTDSVAVQRTRETIADARNAVVSVATPDISQSLRLLRQLDLQAPSVEPDPARQDQ